jgi:hypothetical protein
LVLEVSPLTIATADFATPSFFEISRTSSALAAPSTGGEDTLTFTAPSYSPTISTDAARVVTRTSKIIPSGVSVI